MGARIKRRIRTNAGKLFAEDPDRFRNAHLSRWLASWGLYADGYRRAAELLVRQANTYQDRTILVYPIVFLYRHYLELSLKDFIAEGNRVIEEPTAVPMHHDLNALWSVCEKIARERRLPASTKNLQLIKQYIREFGQSDPTSETFRYPVNRNARASIQDLTRRLSLRGLATAMKRCSTAFGELSGLLDADIGIHEEFQGDEY